jgi:hypothetical protein
MFKKEAWVMLAIFLLPLIVGLAVGLLYPWLKAHGYVN